MGLSSLFSKKPQQTGSADEIEGEYSSRAEEASQTVRGRGKRKAAKASTEPLDPVLPEKKRARRRLVGAVALVIAAVIGLPMVFDSEPKPLPDDIAIQIPSKDQPVPRQDGARPAAAVPAGAALDQHEEVVDTHASLPVAAASQTGLASPKDSTKADPLRTQKVAPSESDNSGADTDHRAAGATSKERLAVTKSKPATTPAADGVKQSDGKAPAALAKAQKPASVAANPGGASDSSAHSTDSDAARARAILDGDADPAVKDVVKPAAKPGHIVLQVAALTSRDKVAELQGKLKAAGIASHTQTVATDSGERIRVRIGPFATKEEADRARARLQGIGLSGSVVPG
ncbi:MAG: SPOR domain-containing protein [Pseudomonadota bacterium]|nr:SPOR domain-containing protein [Pseudomonadota bacterium]